MTVKQTILRKIVAPMLVLLKAQRLGRLKATKDCILMFHGVTGNNLGSVRHMLTPDFVRLLNLLKKEFEVVPLAELHSTKRTPGKKPRAALTFDDGYLNNFEEAAPILKQMNCPATFFLITASLSDAEFTLPIDIIDCIIHKFNPPAITLDEISFRKVANTYRSETQGDIYAYVIANSHKMSSYSAQLKQQFPYDFGNDRQYRQLVRFIDRATLEKLSTDPLFEFSSHTSTHINCAVAPVEQVMDEINSSKKIIGQLTNKECTRIAYPYGLYNTKCRTITREAGYKGAYSVKFELAEDKSDPEIFQRIGISNTTTAEVNLLNVCKLNRDLGI